MSVLFDTGFYFGLISFILSIYWLSQRSFVTPIIVTLLTVGVMFTTIDWLRTKKADFNTASGIFAVFLQKVFCRYDYFGHFDDDLPSTMDPVLCCSWNHQILFIFADLLYL